jgi:phenylalanyl-tRNA synthetase beta chain
LAGQFSQHCQGDDQFTVEQVEVHYEKDGSTKIYPQIEMNEFEVELKYIQRTIGVDINIEKTVECATKMGLIVKSVSADQQKLTVMAPPTRSDIMHACDIAEDIGISFGYNNIPRAMPPTNTIG